MQGGWGQLRFQDQAYHALTFVAALLSLAIGSAALGLTRRRVPQRAIAGFAVAVLWFAWPLLLPPVRFAKPDAFRPDPSFVEALRRIRAGRDLRDGRGMFRHQQRRYLDGTPPRSPKRHGRRRHGVAGLLVFNAKGEQAAHEDFQRIKDTYVRIREHLPQDVAGR